LAEGWYVKENIRPAVVLIERDVGKNQSVAGVKGVSWLRGGMDKELPPAT